MLVLMIARKKNEKKAKKSADTRVHVYYIAGVLRMMGIRWASGNHKNGS